MSEEKAVAVLKENYCFVTYSDRSARFYTIGLMPYSLKDDGEVKSFAFSINYVDKKKKVKSITKEEDILEYSRMKSFFGAENDDKAKEGSLGGRGNTRLTDSNENTFFGYIFSSRSGQKALEWFAERSSHMPNRKDVEVPEDITDEEERERYITSTSKHSLEELAELLDVKLKKTTSKSSPKIIKNADIDAPIKFSSPTKPIPPTRTAQIAGIPTSRKPKETTNEDIQNAINLIFKAIIDGKITEESRFQYYWEDPTGSTTERDEEEKNIPEVYKGYVGTSDMVRKYAKDLLKTNQEGQYDTTEVNPRLTFRLMSHRKFPKE